MSFYQILFIAAALAMDAFAVSVSNGIVIKRNRLGHALMFGVSFGLFQMLMPIIGWVGGRSILKFVSGVDHWIAFFLLTGIGVKMIYESRKLEEWEKRKRITFPLLMMLSLATSVDALAVGLSFSMLNIAIAGPAVITGIVTSILSAAGFFLGTRLGSAFEQKAEAAAGLVLIGIGIRGLIFY